MMRPVRRDADTVSHLAARPPRLRPMGAKQTGGHTVRRFGGIQVFVMEWNVVVTLQARHYQLACQLLGAFGVVSETDYFNVLAMQVTGFMMQTRPFGVG